MKQRKAARVYAKGVRHLQATRQICFSSPNFRKLMFTKFLRKGASIVSALRNHVHNRLVVNKRLRERIVTGNRLVTTTA
jgi:hypothetical protein